MKRVPVKVQRILVFIPVINYLILFVCVYNCMRSKAEWVVFVRVALLMIAYVLAVSGIGYLSSVFLSDMAYNLFFYLSEYFEPLLFGWILIVYQERTIFKS